jgi:hypothetical protein
LRISEILVDLLLISGLIMIAIGTVGVLGYKLFVQLKNRKNAIITLFMGFAFIYISGVINTTINPSMSITPLTENEENIPNQKPTSIPQTTVVTTMPSSSNTSVVKNLNTNLKDRTTEQLQELYINDNFGGVPDYDREFYFGSWEDFDSDCQNTRAEVLINESYSTISFRSNENCVVDSGEWYDPYTDEIFFFASDLDVDHFVPLYDAWYSGAYLWEDYKRAEFANYLEYEDHLIAVDNSTNREKGKRAPQEWMPPNSSYHCEYISIWIEIKYLWELSITTLEYNFLSNLLSDC